MIRRVARKRRTTAGGQAPRLEGAGAAGGRRGPPRSSPDGRLARASRLGHSVAGLVPAASGGTAVQRAVEWSGAKGHRKYNLSHPLLYFTDFGTTTALVNDSKIPPDDPAKALTPPAFLISPKKDEGVRLSVHAEPVNVFGADVDLPTKPPWREVVPVDHALSALGSKWTKLLRPKMPQEEEATVTVEAHGLPDDNTFAALVKDHEQVHVDHVVQILKEIIRPWDAAVSKFRLQGKVVEGKDENEAEEAFHKAIEFPTPAQLGELFKSLFRSYGLDFHKTKEGSSPEVVKVGYDTKPNVLHVYWKHPLG